eukprot:10641896-Alexandrium_andersonii.AAC.1
MALRRWPGGTPGSGRRSKRAMNMPWGNTVLRRVRTGWGKSGLPAWMALRRWPGGALGGGRHSKRAMLTPRGDAVVVALPARRQHPGPREVPGLADVGDRSRARPAHAA